MDIEQLRAELTRRGISFAPNAGLANLEGKLAEAIGKEQEQASGVQSGAPGSELTTTPDVPAGKPGEVKVVEPAAEPVIVPAEKQESLADIGAIARFEAAVDAKVAAGLPRETATEVVKRQLAYDASLKLSEG